jgi:hypothetical protein
MEGPRHLRAHQSQPVQPSPRLSGSARCYGHHVLRSPTRHRPPAGRAGPSAARARGTRRGERGRVDITSSSAHAAAVAAPSPNQSNHHEPSVSNGLPKNPSPSSLSPGSRKKTPRAPEEEEVATGLPGQPEVNAPRPPHPTHSSPDQWRRSRGIRFGIPRCGRGLDLASLFLTRGRMVGRVRRCGLSGVYSCGRTLNIVVIGVPLLSVFDACANDGSGGIWVRDHVGIFRLRAGCFSGLSC